MQPTEPERRFLSILGGYLVSLPFDLKAFQEAVADENLERAARDMAAGTIVHTLLPQEGDTLLRFIDDALIVRAALRAVADCSGDGGADFKARFAEMYENLDADIALFSEVLGDLWTWLASKPATFAKLQFKGRRATAYVEDEESQSALYDEGLEFQTNYNVTEEQVRNRLRRVDQVTDFLSKKRAEEARKLNQ